MFSVIRMSEIMGLSYNPYRHYQKPCGTTRFKTAFPRICRHFLPIRKDAGLNTNYKLFAIYKYSNHNQLTCKWFYLFGN